MRKRGNAGRQHYTCWSDDLDDDELFHTKAYGPREAAIEFAQRRMSHLEHRRVSVRNNTGDITEHHV